MKNENITVTRTQIGQWAGFIGGAALLIGLIGLIWQGGFTAVIFGLLGVGAGGIALWMVLNPAEFMALLSGRQARYGTTAFFSTLLLIGIVVLTYIILQRAVITLDMTEGSRFTLSRETQEVLNRVRRPVMITGFYTPYDIREREVDDQFFRAYEVASNGLIQRQYIDPLESPAQATTFVQRFQSIEPPYNVFVSFLNPDGTLDLSTTTRVSRSTMQERDMTQAISRLLVTGAFTVYFEISHGEYDPLDNSQQGLSLLNNGIRDNSIATMPLNLQQITAEGGTIPDDAAAVIMARPTTALSIAEIAVIDAYLKQGGALFILTDAVGGDNPFLTQDSPFNQYLWDNFGLRALDAVVVDPAASGQTPLDIVSYQVFADTEIGVNLNIEGRPETATLFRVARALEVNDSPPVPNGRIILTSPQSYGETDLKSLRETGFYRYDHGVDLPGPLTTAAWAWDQNTDARVMMVGDGDFVTNGQIISPLGNRTLFMDGLVWMTGFGEQVRFAPAGFSTGLPVFASGQTLDEMSFITVILQPGLVLGIGIFIWIRRTRR